MTAARSTTKAFTVLELLLVILTLMVVASVLLPALSHRHTSCRINCSNNLKQIELSFKTWSLDNGDLLPMQVSATNGGAMELTTEGLAFPSFQVMSNELSTPRILVCPQDEKRDSATNFASLTDKQLSYFLCQDPAEAGNPGLTIGDCNLSNPPVPGTRIVAFTTNLTLAWTKEMHSRQGNLAFTDGSVAQFKNGRFTLTREDPKVRTNRLLVP
jgi:prepilin-type processing-associated H-X9-DG protein